MHPIFEKISGDFNGEIRFVRINVERNGALTNAYSIMSIPTFIIFKDGKQVKKYIGSRSYESLKQDIAAAL